MKKKIKIKVCGLREPSNIDEVCSLKPDYIGFIFYPPSKRYIKDITEGSVLNFIPANIIRTGVFVNGEENSIKHAINSYNLTALQLHGDEPPQECDKWRNENITVIKAFHLHENFNFTILEQYTEHCDYFLFDTKSSGYGGSGQKFGWEILINYKLNKPFFLSGGIEPTDAEIIKNIEHPALYAVDINSRFETKPGTKDIQAVKNFIYQLRS